jgi:hypothetical protein
LCALVFLMTVRHRVMPASADPYDVPVIVLGVSAFALAMLTALAGNYFFGWPFVSSGVWAATILLSVAMTVLLVVGKGWQIVPVGHDTPEDVAIHGQLLLAMVMIFMALLVFVALAVAASTRLGQVATLAVCMGMFVLGAIHPWLFGYWQQDVLAARVLGWGVAKLTYFFQVDALSKDVAIPLGYVAMSAAYCALYTAGALMIGMALFEGRQLEAQGGSASMPGAVALLAWSGRAAAIAAGIVALVMLSLPQFHSLVGLAQAGMVGIAGALGWMLFSAFGTGRKWAYWTTWTLAALVAIAAAVAVALPGQLGVGPVFQRGAAATALAVAVVVNLVMVMPKTRSHFR